MKVDKIINKLGLIEDKKQNQNIFFKKQKKYNIQ